MLVWLMCEAGHLDGKINMLLFPNNGWLLFDLKESNLILFSWTIQSSPSKPALSTCFTVLCRGVQEMCQCMCVRVELLLNDKLLNLKERIF